MGTNIYLDHNATTPLAPEVAETMRPYLGENRSFGNPSRSHWAGLPAKETIEKAKARRWIKSTKLLN
jgi:cysteine desulfurase